MEAQTITGKDRILHFGKEMYPNFNLDTPQRMEVYKSLYNYFLQKHIGKIDPKKGIFMQGGIGVGKTDCFKIMQKIFPGAFYSIDAIKLRRLLRENTYEQTLVDFGYDFRKNLLIDDMGVEDPSQKLFGNTANIIADIIYERYKLWKEKGIKTHLITNLDTTSITEMYGERNIDRLAEMTNMIVFEGNSNR